MLVLFLFWVLQNFKKSAIILINIFKGGSTMKKHKNLDKNINVLDVDSNIMHILSSNNINIIEDLWVLKRNDLKEMNLSDSDIKLIRIKMQLLGIDINKKIY